MPNTSVTRFVPVVSQVVHQLFKSNNRNRIEQNESHYRNQCLKHNIYYHI